MSTISIDDSVRKMLEANAARRGLSLSEYLALMASKDIPEMPSIDASRQEVLRERLRALVAEAETLTPQPMTLRGRAAAFAEARAKKHGRSLR